MNVLDAKKTYKNLKKKGFSESQTKSDDHKYLEFFYKGFVGIKKVPKVK